MYLTSTKPCGCSLTESLLYKDGRLVRQEQTGSKRGMRKGQKDGNQRKMLREKSNFKRAAIPLKYFRKSTCHHWSLCVCVRSGWRKELL